MIVAKTVPQSGTSRGACVATSGLEFQAAHLVGICGSGMKALAEVLSDLGCRVSGSDLHLPESTSTMLADRGWHVHQGHQGTFVPEDAEVLIYSPAISPKNPERLLAARRGLPQFSYSQMLGRLMRDKTGISIAGTHGKSTTTAMTGCILTTAGLEPTVVLGAEVRELNVSGWAGNGDEFVVESCEFQRNFLDLTPRHAVITGIEVDHVDCFANLEETIAAFGEFAQRLPADGLLVINGQCAAARAAGANVDSQIETYSLRPETDWWAGDLRRTVEGIRFRAFYHGDFFAEIALRVPGEHNVLNALAAMALANRAGVVAADIRDGLRGFSGIRRRFETVGAWRGVTLVDDYAHHPTALNVTLQTARDRFPNRKLWCVFQPHQVSRTRALLPEFAASLAAADEVLLVPIFAARERVTDEPRELSVQLAARTTAIGGRARFSPTLDQARATLEDELRAGDVLITIGAGDIGQLHDAFTRRLQRHHAPR